VAGLVGAGGNVGGVAAGFLLKGTGSIPQCVFVLGCCAIVCAVGVALIRFSPAHKQNEQALYDEAIAKREALSAARTAMA
jgi:NNP family nitrate/nitrite transporter-like MFS transporter